MVGKHLALVEEVGREDHGPLRALGQDDVPDDSAGDGVLFDGPCQQMSGIRGAK